MNKDFINFLRNRPPPRIRNGLGCTHGPDEWCDKCLNFGEEVSVKLPNGQISKGFYKINYKE